MTAIDFYYPFDSVEGDRTTLAATERRFFGALFTDGVACAGAFNLSATAAGVYSISPGVAIIGGAIGGITAAKSITAQPAQGSKVYIVLRLDTTNAVRAITLEAIAQPVTATAAQLEAGAQHDLVLYSVENNNGSFGVLDLRTYCTSFDAAIYEQEHRDNVASIETETRARFASLLAEISSAVDAANAQTAGLYGGIARQGFINPQFTVNQRDAEAYSISTGTMFTVDHWLTRIGGGTTSAPVVLTTEQDGARHALKIANKVYSSGTETAASCVAQNIEGGVRAFCAGGKKFTVSFDCKGSGTGRLAVEPVQYAQTGGAGVALAAQVIEYGTTWQRYSLTFEGSVTPEASQIADVLKVGFFFAWRGYDERFGNNRNVTADIYLANVQINEGESALPCFVRSYGEELAACQRYYKRFGAVTLVTGAKATATNRAITAPLPLPCSMAKVPTVTTYDRAGTYNKATVEDTSGAWRNGLAFTISSESTDNPVFVIPDTAAGAISRAAFSRVDVDAEFME